MEEIIYHRSEQKSDSTFANYGKPTIGILGSHSALEITSGAKREGLRNLVISAKGREKTYAEHYLYNSETETGCVNEVMVLDQFEDMLKPEVQAELIKRQTIFVPHRSFEVYVCKDDYSVLNHSTFPTPIFGNRDLLKAEERFEDKNQYYLMEKAGVPFPKTYETYKDIEGISIVKVPEKERAFERGFFLVISPDDFERKVSELIETNKIDERSLEHAVIEEFIIGPVVNLNFFYSSITKKLELIGTDTRRQTNMDGILRLPAWDQMENADALQVKFEEAGHVAITILESTVERAYELGERFVETVNNEYEKGLIGPFALQCAVQAGPPKKDFICFDVSLRVPGSPGIGATPYSTYLYGESMTIGRRISKEVKLATQQDKLDLILT